MTIEYLTLNLDESDNYDYRDAGSANQQHNQIVTMQDGGDVGDDDIGNEIMIAKFGKSSSSEPGAGPGGDDRFIFDLSGFDDDFSIVVKSFDAGDVFQFNNWDTWTTVGTLHTFTYTGSDNATHTVTIDAQSENGDTGIDVVQVVCFARGTHIRCKDGLRPVETLKEGDLVCCGDGTLQPIRWVGSRALSSQDLQADPNLWPIRICRNALGANLPKTDLFLSPQHRVLAGDWKSELLFGEAEVLIAAKCLVNGTTINPVFPQNGVEYFHILLDAHHTVMAEGVQCETLMPAEVANGVLDSQAREEIFALFPALLKDLSSYGPTYRTALKPREAQILLHGRAGCMSVAA